MDAIRSKILCCDVTWTTGASLTIGDGNEWAFRSNAVEATKL